MEKIINLVKQRTEKNISNCLSYSNKIKLDISLDNNKFFEKAVKEIGKKFLFQKTKEENNEKLIQNLKNKFQHFSLDIQYIEEEELIKLIGKVNLKYASTKCSKWPDDLLESTQKLIPIKCTITDRNNCSISFYSLLRDRIGAKANKYYFHYQKDSNSKIENVKIIDLFSSLAEIYIINETLNYAKKNKEIVNTTLDTFNNEKKYLSKFKEYAKTFKENFDNLSSFKTTHYLNEMVKNSAYIKIYTKEIVGAIFKEMVFDNEDIILEEKQLADMKSIYAKAFQEKKNINKETITAMKNSKFNNYFGEIEFDNDVDLKKIKQIENEFIDTINYLNPNQDILTFMKEVALRFRYLGKHKAAGLYFPFYKTMCIDLRDPSAFLHEFMHMIDYQGYKFTSFKLSNKYDFRKISKKYMEIIDKKVNELSNDNKFKKVYNGNTKYNRNYYCNSAEIFARCGEIYLNRILKIDNSLIKDLSEEKIVYPIDIELDKIISDYYKPLFNIEGEYKVSAAAPMIIPIINKKDTIVEIKTTITEDGQLAFIL